MTIAGLLTAVLCGIGGTPATVHAQLTITTPDVVGDLLIFFYDARFCVTSTQGTAAICNGPDPDTGDPRCSE
jgi:hypothetical protein